MMIYYFFFLLVICMLFFLIFTRWIRLKMVFKTCIFLFTIVGCFMIERDFRVTFEFCVYEFGWLNPLDRVSYMLSMLIYWSFHVLRKWFSLWILHSCMYYCLNILYTVHMKKSIYNFWRTLVCILLYFFKFVYCYSFDYMNKFFLKLLFQLIILLNNQIYQ